MHHIMAALIAILILLFAGNITSVHEVDLKFTFPNVTTSRQATRLCTAFSLPDGYISESLAL
jgi:hypothetical protein